jgi:hypothetical protein
MCSSNFSEGMTRNRAGFVVFWRAFAKAGRCDHESSFGTFDRRLEVLCEAAVNVLVGLQKVAELIAAVESAIRAWRLASISKLLAERLCGPIWKMRMRSGSAVSMFTCGFIDRGKTGKSRRAARDR